MKHLRERILYEFLVEVQMQFAIVPQPSIKVKLIMLIYSDIDYITAIDT